MAEGIQFIGSSQKEMRERLGEDSGMPEMSVRPTKVGKRRGRLSVAIQDVLREALG